MASSLHKKPLSSLDQDSLFEGEELSSKVTMLASEASLAKNWLTKEEDEAWRELQNLK